jgi:hypothetical protein
MSVTRRLVGGTAVTLGAGAAGKQVLLPRSHFIAALDRGFRISGTGRIRAVEAVVEQRWNRYADSTLMASSPAAILYFAHGWEWLAGATVSRLRGGPTSDWRTAARTRMSFPVTPRLRLAVSAGTGAENFGTIEQLRFRSSKSIGGTAGIRAGPGQNITFGVHYQRITGGASLASFESAYVVRF